VRVVVRSPSHITGWFREAGISATRKPGVPDRRRIAGVGTAWVCAATAERAASVPRPYRTWSGDEPHDPRLDHAAALDAFNQYLAEGGKKIDAKRHAEIEHHLADLKPLVATLTIQVDAPGAEVTIDDAAVGTSPLAAPITVNAGKRKISAKLPGKAAVTKVITVAGSDTVTVKLEVAEPTKAPPVASGAEDKPKEAPKPTEPGKPIPWVAWGITGVFAASAATMGILTLGAASDLDSKRATANVSRDDLDSASSRTKTFALVTDILLVGTIAAAGVATYLTIKAPKSNDTASTTVQIGVSPTGLAIVGAF